jgi:hypothetical protein
MDERNKQDALTKIHFSAKGINESQIFFSPRSSACFPASRRRRIILEIIRATDSAS